MPIDPTKPLLRLHVGQAQERPTGTSRFIPKPEPFSLDHQKNAFGIKFDRLASILERDQSGMELKSDPSSLAPERLLVFEVRGSIQTFISAIRKVNGLELIDEEELQSDDEDKAPVIYLLVPDALALKNIVSLWHRWNKGEKLGTGFTPWKDVFATLRDIRPWGPQDRIQPDELEIISTEIESMDESELVRLEVELVFRVSDTRANETEADVSNAIIVANGRVLSRCRIAEIGYHAILVELPVLSVRNIIELSPTSIAGLDPVMHIRPQSMATRIEVDVVESLTGVELEQTIVDSPILALLDGVPVSQHSLLAGRLDVNDQFGLEPLALVAERDHGTAMASLIIYGDRNKVETKLQRKIHVVPVLGKSDTFPDDRLIVDIIYQAVITMRGTAEPTAPEVLIVNISLGNTRKPFHGQISAWARLIDRLSYQFGILFIVSAGNHALPFEVPNFANFSEFEDADEIQRTIGTLSAIGQLISERRLLSPSESVNSVTIGAANIDAVSTQDRIARLSVDPFPSLIISNPSSALGPGFATSVKPDILMPGAKEHLSFVASGTALTVRPSAPARARGLKVAAPPRNGVGNSEGFTGGTSAAAALASRTCHQIHDALESEYGNTFKQLNHTQRATLLKALLVHTAKWPQTASEMIKQVLGPSNNRLHVRQKDNIRRFLGYGLVDAEAAITCAEDRATFWASGLLASNQIVKIDVPIPACINGQEQPHALQATLAWFTPTLPGRQSYRMVKLKLLEPEELASLSVDAPPGAQPDKNQSNSGTVFSRRWEGDRAPIVGNDHFITFTVQRDLDQGGVIDDPIPFGFAVTFTMPGVTQIYEEVRNRLAIADVQQIPTN